MGSRRLRLSVVIVLVLFGAGCDWTQFRFSNTHSADSPDRSISRSAVAGLVERWAQGTGGVVESSPAIAAGVAYVGSSDRKLYAFDAKTGAPKWTAATSGAVMSSPAVSGGRVYVGSDDHRLYAFSSANGSSAWNVAVDATFGGLSSAPTVDGDTVYVASASALYAFSATNGSRRWAIVLSPANTPLSAPAVSNGRVFVASYARAAVFAVTANTGTLAWSRTDPGTRALCPASVSSPAVADGVAYVALCPSAAKPTASLFAVRADNGAIQWSAGNMVATTSPALSAGVAYVGSTSGKIEARAVATGSLRWSATIGAPIVSSPGLANGVLYVGADNGSVYAFDAIGQSGCSGTPVVCQPRWTLPTGGAVRSSPAAANGFVYVGSDDKKLHAYGFPPVSFGKSNLAGVTGGNPTVARLGPDGRLYVAYFDGRIAAYAPGRSGSNVYTATTSEVIDKINQIPNHDDDGTLNPTVTSRLITGMLVAGSASSPVIYVASSDPRTGGGPLGAQTNLDTNSGVISRLTRTSGLWARTDLVRGLPRSEENHATNALVLDPTTNILYAAQGGNTNEGAPSHNFNFLPEYAYSAAVLKIDLTAIGNTTYNLPTLVDENNPTLSGPFGGDSGRHQAKIVASSPVQVYAPGFRNAFGMVRSRTGRIYVSENGPNGGWGDVPFREGPGGECTNDVNEPGVHDADSLHLISAGYYGGHPNPTRANRANTFNSTNPQSPVPVANPIECDARFASDNGSIAQLAPGTGGMAEYTASNLADQLDGDLIITGFATGSVYRVKLGDGGTTVASTETLFSNLGAWPVDVAVEGDNDPLPGVMFVPDFGSGTIFVFEPTDFGGRVPPPCSGADTAFLDEDHDGYSNADETDNTTDPCSAADAPHDWNRNFISDRNDPDDDGDGIADKADSFAIDPGNGLRTSQPRTYDWHSGTANNPCAPTPFPSGCPGGLLNLGFSGLMRNGTDYMNQFDPSNVIAGGAAGVLTVSAVPSGDAIGATNTQRYAFQFGVNANPFETNVFTAHARVVAPFAGVTPGGNDSIGFYIGTGDQDNYLKLVLSANNGTPGVVLVKEVGGTPTPAGFKSLPLPGPDAVDLYLTVDPATAQVTARYRAMVGPYVGPLTVVGTAQTIPTSWLASSTNGLALGTIATSAGASPFPATWSVLEAITGTPS